MPDFRQIACDGCGQAASAEHLARRLKRLENMTRYRPVHIQALLLGVASPEDDRDHLYSAHKEFHGEGAEALRAFGIEQAGRSVDETLASFQRTGLLLTHVLECPVSDAVARREALQRRLPATLVRIRRSYRPKKVVLIGAELSEFVTAVTEATTDAVIVLDHGRPFEWTGLRPDLLAKVAGSPLYTL